MDESKLKISIMRIGAHTVLVPGESLTYKNCEELEARLQEVMKGKQTTVILDCKGVSFLDSKALELFVRIQETLKERGNQLKLAGLNPVCRDILIATRLINQIRIYKDMQEAIRETS